MPTRARFDTVVAPVCPNSAVAPDPPAGVDLLVARDQDRVQGARLSTVERAGPRGSVPAEVVGGLPDRASGATVWRGRGSGSVRAWWVV
jgi:hypothetical protein